MENSLNLNQDFQDVDFFSTILGYLHEGVYYVDQDRQILYWNQGAERLTGYQKNEIIGRHCQDHILEHVTEDGTCLCLGQCPLAATIEDGKNRKANVFLHHKDGHRIPVTVQTLPIKEKDGELLGALEVFSENPEKGDEEEKLKVLARLAYLDIQTNLPNQNYLFMKLRAILEELNRSHCLYGVIMERVDNYTDLYDHFPQPVMDRILSTAGNTLKNNIPATSMIGRWDHQTYLIILPNFKKEQLEVLGRRLGRLVEQSTLTIERKTAKSQVSFRYALLEEARDENSLLAPLLAMPYLR